MSKFRSLETRIRALGKDEQLSRRHGRSANLHGMAFAVVLESKIPPQNLHHVQNGTHRILLEKLLKVVIHLDAVMPHVIRLELQRAGTRCGSQGGELLVDGVYNLLSDGGPMQGERFLRRHLKAGGLHLERLLENNVGHD